MQLLASAGFLDTYQRRGRDARLLESLHACITTLSRNPRHPGLHTEKLFENTRVANGVDVLSARINIQFRLVFATIPPAKLVLLHFDNHDEAYDWATRNLKQIERQVARAQPWEGRPGAKAVPFPRLDEDDLVPVSGVELLQKMLAEGMQRYIAALDETQRSYVTFDFLERTGLTFVRGGAGTGKTAIAVHRALHLAQQSEIDRQGVQYLCYNNVLASVVRETMTELAGGRLPEGLDVSTFHAWCLRYLEQRGITVEIPSPDSNWLNGQVRGAAQRLRLAEKLEGLSVPDIVYEIGAVKRLGLQDGDAYLALDRTGMRMPLKREQREAIWRVFEEVRYRPGREAEYDDLPGIALAALEQDADFKPYRAVVVDEAQDCSPVMARLARKMVLDDHRRLMVLADPAQGIYPNGFAWARREFAPRGAQNVVLRRPYRSTRQVHALASSLYANMPDMLRGLDELKPGVRDGPRPEVHLYASTSEAEQALVAAVRAEIEAAEDSGRRPEEIAVLVRTNEMKGHVIGLLQRSGITATSVERGQTRLDRPGVKVMTVHASKGLDFPSVYVFQFASRLGDSPEERSLLYVALTRSSFRLTLVCDKDHLSPLLQDLDPQTYVLRGTARGLLEA